MPQSFSLPCEPNLTARSYAAHYVFKARGLGKQELSSIAGNPDFTVLFKDKNGEKVKSAGEKIYMLKAVGDDAAEAVLACGNDNLRADRVLKQLCADFSLDWDAATVTKIRLLLDGAEDADEFLLKLQKRGRSLQKLKKMQKAGQNLSGFCRLKIVFHVFDYLFEIFDNVARKRHGFGIYFGRMP